LLGALRTPANTGPWEVPPGPPSWWPTLTEAEERTVWDVVDSVRGGLATQASFWRRGALTEPASGAVALGISRLTRCAGHRTPADSYGSCLFMESQGSWHPGWPCACMPWSRSRGLCITRQYEVLRACASSRLARSVDQLLAACPSVLARLGRSGEAVETRGRASDPLVSALYANAFIYANLR